MSVLGEYRDFVARHRRFVGFGFLFAAGSSFGQTYFIGVFGPSIQAEFGLSHTQWGTIYLIGTLASAMLLPWTGRYIDRMNLMRYSYLVLALMICACLVAAATPGPVWLILSIFFLRQSGQGLMSHVAITSMGRYFESHRGRAIAVASLGFAAAEAILPYLAVTLIAVIGWRYTYVGSASLLLLGLVPLVSMLLRGQSSVDSRAETPAVDSAAAQAKRSRSWTLAEMMRDGRFLMMLPGLTAPSAIVTALFFHHLNIADSKGWSAEWITGSYGIYALFITLTSLVAGPLVDRLGAVRLVPFMLVPLILALLTLALFNASLSVWLYMTMIGIHTGISHTAVSAMWAELYGVTHLGAIKSFATAISVFASAMGPVTFGILLDQGFTVELVFVFLACYTLVAGVLLMSALPPRATPTGC